MSSLTYFQKFMELIQGGESFVQVMVVDSRGSYPQNQGAKMLVSLSSKSSPLEGTIGGGSVEANALKHALEMLSKDKKICKTELITWNLSHDLKMTCGGEVSLFFEIFGHNPWKVAIFGAGHVTQALVPLLLSTECQVFVVDHREEWLNRLPGLPQLKPLLVEDMAAGVDLIPADCFIISMTPGHLFDKQVLTAALRKGEPPYIGAIGSKTKAMDLKEELKKQGILPERISKIFCPIGLPFGKNTPSEVAISIMAQLIQERDRQQGG